MRIADQIERALTGLKTARRRGRPIAQDQRLAEAGFMPVSIAAIILRKRIGTLYQARDMKRLEMVLVEGSYWYVHRAEVLRYAATPVRLGRPPKGASDAR